MTIILQLLQLIQVGIAREIRRKKLLTKYCTKLQLTIMRELRYFQYQIIRLKNGVLYQDLSRELGCKKSTIK